MQATAAAYIATMSRNFMLSCDMDQTHITVASGISLMTETVDNIPRRPDAEYHAEFHR